MEANLTSPPSGTLLGMPIRLHKLEGKKLAAGDGGNCSLLFVLWRGSLQLQYAEDDDGLVERPLRLEAGELLLLPPGHPIRLEANAPLGTEGMLLELELYGSDSFDGLHVLQSGLRLKQADEGLLAAARQLFHGWSLTRQQPWQLQALFVELMRRLYEAAERNDKGPETWMEDSLAYIQAHYQKELSRDLLARRAGVSPEHYSRCFRAWTGSTLTNYLSLLRVRRAQELLLSGQGSTLNQVAREVGYSEGLYLSRKFKQVTGMSPSRYRKSVLRTAALNINHSASLWALGVEPQWGVFSDWFAQSQGARANYSTDQLLAGREGLGGMEEMGASSEQPDVILSYELSEPMGRLLELAPVVQLSHLRMSWQSQFRLIADIIGRRSQAEELLGPIGEAADRLRHRLFQRHGTARSAVIWEIGHDNKAYAIAASHGRGAQLLYGELGLRMPQALLELGAERRGFVEKTMDDIAQYDADFIIITGPPSCRKAARKLGDIFRSERWLGLEAVRAGNAHLLEESNLFHGYDPLSSREQLRVLEKTLF
ncbi:substrate-binding protein [Paenibacillaceae bacterium GAS479]|nr:substrate-binding protein [Paenibacillaceae bacterium GAS479]